jgi:hypothetical protein
MDAIFRAPNSRALNWFKERARRKDQHGAMETQPVDLRSLAPPEPMLRILERIGESPGPHLFLLPFAPTPIYPLLASYGWLVETRNVGDGVEVRLVRRA